MTNGTARQRRVAETLLLAGALLACAEERASTEQASTDGKDQSKAAIGQNTPSQGTMCPKHGVILALCTKCNPKLVPVFQAKGDWCQEHAFPESICPICHPERGGRPQADLGQELVPADGTKIRFKRAGTAASAGIQTVRATLLETRGGVVALARVTYDATKLARLNPRSPGVVRAVQVDVGSAVKKGQSLVVIDSPEIGADRARLEAARSAVETATINHERAERMAQQGVGSQQALLDAKQQLSNATAEHAAIAASLASLGAGKQGGGGYTLTAPLAGVVTDRTATIGKQVSPDEVLIEIVDTSTMWADLDVPESDVGLVRVGQTVSVTLEALHERSFSGKLEYLAPAVDPHTRTVRGRVSLANPDAALRAQMFGEARIDVDVARQVVSVPRSAVQRVKDKHLAFVRISAEEYETRRIEVGVIRGERIEVTRGLRADEEVVTTGSFLLKTETLKGSIGAGCCEGE